MRHSNSNLNGNDILTFARGNPKANEAARRLAEVQEDAFRKIAMGNPLLERSITVSRGLTSFYPGGVERPGELREILAAKALGLIQSLHRNESDEFLAKSSGLVFQEMQKEGIPDIFTLNAVKGAEDGRMDVLGTVLSHSIEAVRLFKIYRSVCKRDVTDKDKSEYEKHYATPILEDEIPRVVMLLRFVDLSEDIEKKIALLGETGPFYNDRELLELSKTMMDVHYPLSDAIGLGTTRAVRIRRHATNILEAVLKRKAEAKGADEKDIEKLKLYEKCKIYFQMLEERTEKLAAEFIKSGELAGILEKIGQKTKLEIGLASHTSDNEHVYRIKGPSGIFWKVIKHREAGENYGIGDVRDFLATTAVVKGDFDDARAVARRIELSLTHRFRTFDTEMDADERPTGYRVPHITCGIKVDGIEVPFEVQVRTAEAHQESKTGSLSHAAKISGFITQALIDKLKPTFEEMQRASDTLKMMRERKASSEKSDRQNYSVKVMEMDGKEAIGSSQMGRRAVRGESVGGLLALVVGLEKNRAVDVFDMNHERLRLESECPHEVVIEVREGRGMSKETCDMLLNGKVLTPEAIEIFSEYRKKAPRKGWFGRG